MMLVFRIVFQLVLGLGLLAGSSRAQESRPNVLMIAIDDLNDWVGCMGGHPNAETPNIDRIAAQGVTFMNNHCQAPICGPSRASLMTGLYPSTTGIYLQIQDDKIKKASKPAAKSVFMTDWFDKHGYALFGTGKILHNGGKMLFRDYGQDKDMGPKPEARMKWPAPGFPPGTQTDWGAYPERDEQMPDFKSAEYAVSKLGEKHDKPFFLAVGFCRPHVPWHVPQKWFDMFPPESLKLPPYLEDDMQDVPEMAKKVAAVPMMPTTEWAIKNKEWRNIVQAYLACTTFVDAQIGKILDALEKSGQADNTIIVLWSDHGYHLGEKNRFAKQAIWERDTRTVMILKAPGAKAGAKCNAPTELLDIYPTLLDLCGLPANPQNEGQSLVPLLTDPETDWPHLARTSYGVGNITLRDRTHRYTVYEDGSEELYDMIKDPNEWTNLAGKPGSAEVIERFRPHLPKAQAPMAKHSRYSINSYWRDKMAEKGKKRR